MYKTCSKQTLHMDSKNCCTNAMSFVKSWGIRLLLQRKKRKINITHIYSNKCNALFNAIKWVLLVIHYFSLLKKDFITLKVFQQLSKPHIVAWGPYNNKINYSHFNRNFRKAIIDNLNCSACVHTSLYSLISLVSPFSSIKPKGLLVSGHLQIKTQLLSWSQWQWPSDARQMHVKCTQNRRALVKVVNYAQ